MNNEFGNYLKELRLSRSPQMTQEQLAIAIGRSKMTISQFEKGKNAPPQGELLDKIIVALSLTQSEKSKLLFLSARSRGILPNDIEEYFFENPEICDVIRAAMNSGDDVDWLSLVDLIGASNAKD